MPSIRNHAYDTDMGGTLFSETYITLYQTGGNIT